MYTSNFNNLILNSDSYKTSHWVQYPPGSEYMSSYVEARKGDFDVVFFGLQAFIKEYLSRPITQQDIDEAELVITAHGLTFNRTGWERLLEKHGGYLPLRIEAVPEGSIVPVSNVVYQIVNTDPEFYWLPSYISKLRCYARFGIPRRWRAFLTTVRLLSVRRLRNLPILRTHYPFAYMILVPAGRRVLSR